MCGIVAILIKNARRPGAAWLERVREVLAYRGPGAEGQVVFPPHAHPGVLVSLGYSQLAISESSPRPPGPFCDHAGTDSVFHREILGMISLWWLRKSRRDG